MSNIKPTLKTISILGIFIIVALLSSCTKEDEPIQPPANNNVQDIELLTINLGRIFDDWKLEPVQVIITDKNENEILSQQFEYDQQLIINHDETIEGSIDAHIVHKIDQTIYIMSYRDLEVGSSLLYDRAIPSGIQEQTYTFKFTNIPLYSQVSINGHYIKDGHRDTFYDYFQNLREDEEYEVTGRFGEEIALVVTLNGGDQEFLSIKLNADEINTVDLANGIPIKYEIAEIPGDIPNYLSTTQYVNLGGEYFPYYGRIYEEQSFLNFVSYYVEGQEFSFKTKINPHYSSG